MVSLHALMQHQANNMKAQQRFLHWESSVELYGGMYYLNLYTTFTASFPGNICRYAARSFGDLPLTISNILYLLRLQNVVA